MRGPNPGSSQAGGPPQFTDGARPPCRHNLTPHCEAATVQVPSAPRPPGWVDRAPLTKARIAPGPSGTLANVSRTARKRKPLGVMAAVSAAFRNLLISKRLAEDGGAQTGRASGGERVWKDV